MEGAYYAEPIPLTRRERFSRWLFPLSNDPPHDSDLEERIGPTFLMTHVQVHADWRDRLRLLWSGRFEMRVRTYTDVEVKRAESVTRFTVMR